ncbi:exosome component 10 isoform X1 [Cimex lectularius]|uniref:Exosome complex component 10 homolog n=1 Tax=Cimex lectularius TaxID=79782 RepID=A0A8I6S2B5_CIMLE|nr:exosome component 10 isoform X1 [Cimex lectularius]
MDDALVQEGDILPGCANFEEFVQAAYPIVMNGVRLSNNLPSTQQYSYFKTYKEFEDIMKAHGKRLQDTIQMLLVHMDTKRTIHHQPADEKFELIVDTNDKLLDRAHKSMSEMDGTRFNPDEDFGESSHRQISGSWNRKNLDSVKLADKADDVVKLTVQQRTIRPQALFKDKIDNSNRPWEPRIKEKPNALKPLSVLLTVNERGQETYTHPYEFELDMWKPSEERLTLVHVVEEPKDLEETQLIYVQTEKELELMVADLLQQNEFSVDLEHHSYRSFMGFTCLMQISTKDTDFIIDALKLRHKMHILNTVFTKPNILKIFHGASNDIDWLQRDFSLYVVNMFDTYQAAKVLDFPKLSLAYLLKHYCKIEASKKFQLYDWRIRPLPNKAKNYAREDTHYLIYIYQMMNNELFAKGNGPRLIDVVYKKSIETCKQVYMKPLLDENSHMNLYRRMGRPFDTRQLFALKEIYKWRDNVAREEDESPGYVLSNHMMMQMAQTLPREVQGILACCNPIPPLVRQHAVDIHKIILKAKEVPLVKEDSEVSCESEGETEEEEPDTSDEDWEAGEDESDSSGAESAAEDEFVVAAIKKRQRIDKSKPPYINIEDAINDSSFSPENDIIVLATSAGDLLPFTYGLNACNGLGRIEAHTDDCRVVEFSSDGGRLFSGGKDKTVVVSDLERRDMISFYQDAHDEPVSALTVLDDNLICTGDDGGNLKIWDLRERKSVASNKPRDISDYISSVVYKEGSNFVSCTSGEGNLTIYDLKRLTICSQSEHHKSDLTCSVLIKREDEIVCGSLTGEMIMYKWAGTAEPLGKYDPVPKTPVNCMLAVSENLIITGWEDKKIRAFHLYPNEEVGIVGQHDMPVEGLEMSRDGDLIASTSAENKLKFWNIGYLEDYEANKRKKKKKGRQSVNLPSSAVEDRGSFFSELL